MANNTERTFTNKLGFILASVGSAIGMGNIWLFPYRLGKYGGAAFLIPYFLFVALFGYVGLSGEFALGRLTGTGPIGSYEYAMSSRGKKGGAVLGTLPLLGSMGIAIGYAVIVGWVLKFMTGSLTGSLMAADSAEYFASITGNFGSIAWHSAVIIISAMALLFGVVKGIEKVSRFMMPAFFVLFVVLAIRVAFLPGAIDGYKYLLMPKWEQLLNPMTWVMAMGQAFFSLSITGSGMIIYGSYLSKDEDVIHSSVVTAILDTCAALLSGFVIIPAVFAFGMDPKSGPPLMFITMPKIFAQMPMGRLFGFLFFLSVLFAGITSLINMLEVCTEAASSRLKWKRNTAIIVVSAIVLGIGLFMEFEPNLGRWMDFITIDVSPIGAVMGAIIIYWVVKKDEMKAELNLARKRPIGDGFFMLARWVYIPVAILVVILGLKLGGIG